MASWSSPHKLPACCCCRFVGGRGGGNLGAGFLSPAWRFHLTSLAVVAHFSLAIQKLIRVLNRVYRQWSEDRYFDCASCFEKERGNEVWQALEGGRQVTAYAEGDLYERRQRSRLIGWSWIYDADEKRRWCTFSFMKSTVIAGRNCDLRLSLSALLHTIFVTSSFSPRL